MGCFAWVVEWVRRRREMMGVSWPLMVLGVSRDRLSSNVTINR